MTLDDPQPARSARFRPVRFWSRRFRPRRRVALAALAALLVPVLLVIGAFAGLLGEDLGPVASAVPASGHDGLWLGHAWVDGRNPPADLDALVVRLRKTGIRDLFVHVGPLSDDGSLNPALSPRARWLLTGLHQQLPGVRVQAWLGDLVGPGQLDLASSATRARALGAAAQVLAEGFDGVQYDLEPVPSGDRGYLTLLSAARRLTRSRHAVLSVAADQVEPAPYLHVIEQQVFGQPHWWSTAYLHAVAGRVDEVALMTYDTGVPTGAAYSGYVRLETRLALGAVPPDVTVLIGLPAFHDRERGHTAAETVTAAIRGVRLALGRPGDTGLRRRLVGVAIYADFSARPSDWAAYLNDWARPGARPGAAPGA